MSNETQNREEYIFLEALEPAPGESRDAYLDEACADDADLRGSVEAPLKAYDEPASFLRNTEVGVGAGSPAGMDAGGEQDGRPMSPNNFFVKWLPIGDGESATAGRPLKGTFPPPEKSDSIHDRTAFRHSKWESL